MNIREGDVLVIGDRRYPIKSCADWSLPGRHSITFRRMATLTASTERTTRDLPETLLTGLKCTPLDPVDPDLRRRMALETPHELLQTYIADTLGFVHLILEDIKR